MEKKIDNIYLIEKKKPLLIEKKENSSKNLNKNLNKLFEINQPVVEKKNENENKNHFYYNFSNLGENTNISKVLLL